MIYAIHSTLNGIILVLAARIDGSMAGGISAKTAIGSQKEALKR